jgi:hypothetical protein
MRNLSIATLALLFTVGCTAQDDTVDDFSDLAGVDTKSDLFSKKMKIAGAIADGQSVDVDYTKTPLYRALTLDGLDGMKVSVNITSWDGTAVAWLLDSNFKTVIKGTQVDDGDFIENQISATLAAEGTYYIVLREEYKHDSTFSVELTAKGGTDYFACKVDSDCVATPRNECCGTGWMEGVNKKEVSAYHASFTCPQAHPICPLYLIDDTRVAQCNNDSHKCEMVDPAKSSCGGFVANPHQCAKGYTCSGAKNPDLPGTCTATKTDACNNACGADQECSYCWGKYACIPKGALC